MNDRYFILGAITIIVYIYISVTHCNNQWYFCLIIDIYKIMVYICVEAN